MNDKLENLMYQAGLTAQGCWDNMDEYDHAAIQKFAELIVQKCADYIRENMDSEQAEPLAFCMERDFGLHGDYA